MGYRIAVTQPKSFGHLKWIMAVEEAEHEVRKSGKSYKSKAIMSAAIKRRAITIFNRNN